MAQKIIFELKQRPLLARLRYSALNTWSNTWPKLGLESHARDLGMNSHSFLFSKVTRSYALTYILNLTHSNKDN